jgi:hypothetical protein
MKREKIKNLFIKRTPFVSKSEKNSGLRKERRGAVLEREGKGG